MRCLTCLPVLSPFPFLYHPCIFLSYHLAFNISPFTPLVTSSSNRSQCCFSFISPTVSFLSPFHSALSCSLFILYSRSPQVCFLPLNLPSLFSVLCSNISLIILIAFSLTIFPPLSCIYFFFLRILLLTMFSTSYHPIFSSYTIVITCTVLHIHQCFSTNYSLIFHLTLSNIFRRKIQRKGSCLLGSTLTDFLPTVFQLLNPSAMLLPLLSVIVAIMLTAPLGRSNSTLPSLPQVRFSYLDAVQLPNANSTSYYFLSASSLVHSGTACLPPYFFLHLTRVRVRHLFSLNQTIISPNYSCTLVR